MTTEASPTNKLIDDLTAARAAVLAEIQAIPESSMGAQFNEGWTMKDIVAHIASWDEAGWIDLERAARGHIPFLLAFQDGEIDDWNAWFMRGRRAFTLPQVMFELEDRRARLLAVLEENPALTDSPLTKRLTDVLIEHDTDHAKEIRDWRQANGV